ncbi:hypothetical protein [Paraburkholderia sp. MM5477-R1]|uniref:hypothetical protein n=1 Tax=Paraburkholderia sp. MM5477-R1 TaxID=2991062 RepID=UPI003D1C5244
MRLSLLAVLTGLTGLLCYCVFVRHWDGALAALVIGGAGLVASLLLIGALLLIAPAARRPAMRQLFLVTLREDLRTLRAAVMFWRAPPR